MATHLYWSGVFSKIQNLEDKMEDKLPTIPPPQNRGALLLQSQWQLGQTETIPVQVFTSGIQAAMRFLPFTFDLKFGVQAHTLTLSLSGLILEAVLPLQDQQQWRFCLKGYLNQLGFHVQFKPVKKIGKGSFASVYLVQRVQDGKEFAVKAFSKQAAFSEEHGKQCLIREIDIMRHLRSPFNLSLCEVFQSQNSLYLIFQLLTGGQLFQKFKNKEKLTATQVQTIMRCLLQGLEQLHAKGIMHRDLKPENILLRNAETCECVIADFGLAEFSNSQQYLFVRCGTPGYVAPQVINIKDMTARYSPICDLFSLGLIFHLLLFGRSIFKGKTYNEVLNENRNCSFSLQQPEYHQLPPSALDLLSRLLAVDPASRITAFEALQHPFINQSAMEVEDTIDQMALEQMDRVEVGQSPILTSANQQRKQQKDLRRDSCLPFKMGKETGLTGKTETAGSLNSSKLSGFGSQLLKSLKPSKFTKPIAPSSTS